MRRTVAPVRLDGITLGKGATIIIPIYVVHRHKRLWEDRSNSIRRASRRK
jgi:cytochrome P450